MLARARSYSVKEGEASGGPALRQAREGQSVDITAHGEVVAHLIPASGLIIEWGRPGGSIGLDPPEPVAGGVQDLIREGRR